MRIIVVTGANRGIGYEAVQQLAAAGHTVILTARDEVKGKAAVESLLKAGMKHVVFHSLDVISAESVEALRVFVEQQYGKLDVLINNAGIISKGKGISEATLEEIKEVMETNYFGPLRVTKAMIPLLKESSDARVINISSGMGVLEDLDGSYAGYRLSKAGLNNLTLMLANDLSHYHIKVNSMCPGWVRTDMGGASAPLTVQEGADTAVWLATSDHMHTGKFFRDRKEISF